MRNEPLKDLLEEWIAELAGTPSGGPKTLADAEAHRDHAIGDLEEDGMTEEKLDAITGGDFGSYLLERLTGGGQKSR